MKIISKRGLNDYYDYICGTEGIDNRVVYDRREPCILNKSTYEGNFADNWLRVIFGRDVIKSVYSSEAMFNDQQKHMSTKWVRVPGKQWPKRVKTITGNTFIVCLEVGFLQWYFEIERWLDESDKLNVARTLIEKKRIQKSEKASSSVVSVIPCTTNIYGNINFIYKYGKLVEFTNPIMKDTWIPSMIDARDMYDAIYECCAAQNDHEFVDSRTNDEHIESNGFDRKTSFRNIK